MNQREWVENVQTGFVRMSNAAAVAKVFTVMDLATAAAGLMETLVQELDNTDAADVPFDTPTLTRKAWQPIATAPKDGTWILCSRDNGGGSKFSRWIGCWARDNRGGYWVDNTDGIREPTHWQPLEDAPAKVAT